MKLDGERAASLLRESICQRLKVSSLRPCLGICLVGDSPASDAYVHWLKSGCRAAGVEATTSRLPQAASTDEVLAVLTRWNADPSVHGIIVQLPLPPQVDGFRVANAVAPEKDVDCSTSENIGRLSHGRPRFLPCTPAGILHLLDFHGIQLRGAHVAIVNRGNVVGLPLAVLLSQADATATVCHEHTRDLRGLTASADVVVTAVGRPGYRLTADMVRPGAVVVDVATRREGGRLVGDCDPSVSAVAAWVSPVPGGVGPMTVAKLLENTAKAAEALS